MREVMAFFANVEQQEEPEQKDGELRDDITTWLNECENVIDISYIPQIYAIDRIKELEEKNKSLQQKISLLEKNQNNELKNQSKQYQN